MKESPCRSILVCLSGVALTASLVLVAPPSAASEGSEGFAWGANSSGQLGDGSTTNASTPVPILGGANARKSWTLLGRGGEFSCGIAVDGSAYCWGSNDEGQLGKGTIGFSPDDSIPAPLLNGANIGGQWSFLEGGWQFTCGLGTNARTYCWGENGSGQVGNGTKGTNDDSLPRLVKSGDNTAGAWSSLSVGYDFACGLAANAAAYCWGSNGAGQLGTGPSGSSDDSVPRAVVSGANALGTWSSISAGSAHTCGIAPDGRAYCWGGNFSGQLGDNSTTGTDSPVAVSSAVTWKVIAAGEANTCGISSDNEVYCWGANNFGQLGQGTTGSAVLTPLIVPGLSGAVDVAMGQDHSCAMTPSSVYCWGSNSNGQVGDGTHGGPPVPSPYEVTSGLFSGLVPRSLSLGSYHSMALMGAPAPPPSPDPIPASPPRDVMAQAADGSARITWSAAASSGSFPVSHYLATAAPSGRTCLVTAPALTCEVTGLSNGTAYTFTVKALTGAGWSSASDPSNAVVPRAQPKPSIVITGVREGKRIGVSGTTTGFSMGAILNPWVKLTGQAAFVQSSVRVLVSADGTFEWARKTGKRAHAYMQALDGSVRSNTVTIRAR